MIKSFITFYLIQYHKNAFHGELFLSIYSMLQIELHFAGLVKITAKSQPWVACKVLLMEKGMCLEKKKQLVKQIFNPYNNFISF